MAFEARCVHLLTTVLLRFVIMRLISTPEFLLGRSLPSDQGLGNRTVDYRDAVAKFFLRRRRTASGHWLFKVNRRMMLRRTDEEIGTIHFLIS